MLLRGMGLACPARAAATLPGSLASLLRHADSRRKHKRLHSGGEKKSSKKWQGERSKVGRIWLETEEYFRDLGLNDIDGLHNACRSVSELGCSKCMMVPFLHGDNAHVDVVLGEDKGALEKEKKEDGHEKLMDVDKVGHEEEAVYSVSGSSIGLEIEWLMGCREKVCLASERPSKKRKLLGSDAGLEKVMIAQPCEGNQSLCNFCCRGELGRESNSLLVCSSCKTAVHIKCYGVQEYVHDSWLCSWCERYSDGEVCDGHPCVLCTKSMGALKPVSGGDKYEGKTEFAHLFCSLWMSEVYVEDLKRMEPIMNVQEINATRKKLVCNICKIKSGACIRCSHGSCRTSFHPICAREASHRMEIWGKFGQDDVELRAFCSNHSLANSGLSQSGSPAAVADIHMHHDTRNESSSSDYCYDNGDNGGTLLDTQKKSVEANSKKLREVGLPVTRARARSMSESSDQGLGQLEKSDSVACHEEDSADSLNFVLILKKLVDRGKVNLKDVASEIGIPLSALHANLSDDSFVPDLRRKLASWLKDHALIGALQKDGKIKVKPLAMTAVNEGPNYDSDTVSMSNSDMSDPVTLKSVPPRRRTKSDVRVLKDGKNSHKGNCKGSGTVIDGEVDRPINPDTREKAEGISSEQKSAEDFGILTGAAADSHMQSTADLEPSTLTNAHHDAEVCNLGKEELAPSFFMHPHTRRTLMQVHGRTLIDNTCENLGSGRGLPVSADSSLGANVCCSNRLSPKGSDISKNGSEEISPELLKDAKMGILEMSPNDEVEGEILYIQSRLLSNAAVKKQFSDVLITKIIRDLPWEIDTAGSKMWDIVLINKYLSEVREAKKQGRKERKHKEAQAILAAASAAAATSSRISSLRKDGPDGTRSEENLLKFNSMGGRVGYFSQLIPQPKEALSKLGFVKVSAERNANSTQVASDHSRHGFRVCDICSRPETVMNTILVCSSCKVSVHSDCYHSVKESTGPWRCELCEELLGSGSSSMNFREKFVSAAECALCGGTTGAFRKSDAGQWVHAFCAEWVLESTFTRGQANPVEGMDAIPKEVNECNICHHKYGACIKCNYGHCQSTFHPSCARSVGLFMNVKSVGEKLQHKAYCGRHSLEQKAKVESQKYGIEEQKSVKQMRVELEKLRLLCERIVKREKVKREIVLCTHDILALKRNMVACSILVQIPPGDGSSESATTSVNYRSVSESIQKSDEMTVDSGISRKRQIPYRPPVPLHNASNNRELRIKFKHAETFEKELVMTSDQADLKNKLLPKGYAYVPSDSIPKDKETREGTGSDEQLPDGG
ncbi:hypothetical protein MLD38_034084 [Melastoma candidum]|uniref:Uncharacterized protein n=1 Tax=Melastoma candidum TaxID=119954 RepID=A0ACB9MA80_9MYRT|nr:hypothetical protein MLD38_034084 [Melastoma candidum]